jgi:hypothetical protein
MLNFTSGDFRVDAIIKFSITTLLSFLLFSSKSNLKYQIFSDLRDFFFRIHLFGCFTTHRPNSTIHRFFGLPPYAYFLFLLT